MLAGAAICVLAGSIFAKPGVLVTTDGRRLEGDITERDDDYLVTIRGVQTTINKASVTYVDYPDAYSTDFHNRLSKLEASDVSGRIALAREAFDRRQYGLARQALDSALKIDPNSREATDLQNTIYSQMRLEQNRNAPPNANTAPTPPPMANGVEKRLLTQDDINVMRQNELRPNDHVGVRLDNNVDKRFMRYRNIQFNDFNALKPVDKALAILKDGDETMRADVKVLGDPASVVDYKRLIQPVILNGCAAANCHGGAKGGNFVLYNPADTDAEVYTDLYILFRYRTAVPEPPGGTGLFNSKERKMVDRGAAAHSLLGQYSLPADISAVDHPVVPGYDFVYRNTDDVRYVQLLTWMNKTLAQPDPDYSMIRYEPPVAATSQPATRGAR
jgi:hypothetical protein